jgi:hypothetical protein
MIKTIALNIVYLSILKLLNHIGEDTWNLNTILGCVFMVYNGLAHFFCAQHTTAFLRFSNTVYLNTLLFMLMSQTIGDNSGNSTAETIIKKTYMWVNIVLCIYSSIIVAFIGIEDYLRHSHNPLYGETVRALIDAVSGHGGTRNTHITFMGFELYNNGINVITEDDLEAFAPTYNVSEISEISETQETRETQNTCPICLDTVSGLCRKLSCEHTFHAICIDSWVLKAAHSTCPLCRSSIRT